MANVTVISLKQFESRIRLSGRNLERHVKGVQGLLFFELYKRLLMGTPIDTGQARANWIPSVGSVSDEVLIGKLSSAGQIGAAPTGEELQAIRGQIALLKSLPVGQTAWIVNNLDYVVALDEGHGSTQAPAGIAKIACQGAVEAVSRRAKVNLLAATGNSAKDINPFTS